MAWTLLSSGQKAAALAGGGVVVVVVAGLAAGWLGRTPVPDSPPLAVAEPPVLVPIAEPVADVPLLTDTAADSVATAKQPVVEAIVAEVPIVEGPTAEVLPEAPVVTDPPVAGVAAAGVAALPVTAPSFDLVRVDPDGAVLVAGRAQAGAQVDVQVDTVEVASTIADSNGKFVAQFMLAPGNAPRLMALVMRMPGEPAVPGKDTVAIAPFSAPVVTAAVEPAPLALAEAVPEALATALPEAKPEPSPPAALLVTPKGVEVLQPDTPLPAGLAENVSIDSIAYAPDGAVMLGGRGLPLRFLRIYLDNAGIAELVVPQSGQWARTLPGVAPGIYALRVDQLDAEGKVTSRFETPFKRETLEALAAVATQPTARVVEQTVPPEPAQAEPAQAEPAQTESAQAEPAQPEPAQPAKPEPVAEVGTVEVASAPPAVVAESSIQPAAEPVVAAATEPAASQPAAAPAPPPPVSVTVQPGLTLWAIAQENFGDGVMYVEVYAANKDKIRNPDLIYPGQVFTIPKADP